MSTAEKNNVIDLWTRERPKYMCNSFCTQCKDRSMYWFNMANEMDLLVCKECGSNELHSSLLTPEFTNELVYLMENNIEPRNRPK